MTNYLKMAAAAVAMLMGAGAAQADECKAAQGLVDKAIAHYKAVGKEKSFADFGNKENKDWVDGELYVIVSSTDGIFKSHPNKGLVDNPKLPGLKDVNGVMIIQEMIRVGKETPGGGWAKYTWDNPVSKKLAAKHTWVKLHDDQLFMAGCYP